MPALLGPVNEIGPADMVENMLIGITSPNELPSSSPLDKESSSKSSKPETIEISSEGGGIISTTMRISPPKDSQIHAQIDKDGDGGDGGDTFGVSSKSSYNIGQASIITSHHARRSPRK